MVKLKGPGLATAAAGQLAGELVFSSWKGGAYLKRHRKPKQPRSASQVAMRAMLSFLARSWEHIPQDRRDTWLELAAADNITAFNAYQAYNLARWGEHKLPSQSYPALAVKPASSFQGYHIHGLPLAVRHETRHDHQFFGWGFALYRVAGPYWLCTWDNLLYVDLALSIGTRYWTQRNLSPGTYYTKSRNFSIDGQFGYQSILRSATVTN